MTHFCQSCGQQYQHNCSQTKGTRIISNFDRTLEVMQEVLMTRLRPGFTKIWVQGHNKPNATTLLFTIFSSNGYTMRTHTVRNFRQFRQENQNVDEEMTFINRHISSFESTLNEFIHGEIQS